MTGAAGVPMLHGFLSSGNDCKCRLLLYQPAIPCRRVELGILKGGRARPSVHGWPGRVAKQPRRHVPIDAAG